MSKEDKFCANCVMHDWKQLEDKSLLEPCCKVTSFSCRKILYCGTACRREHWAKVHKNHCQFLADPSKCPQSQHDADTCAICRPPAGTGKGKRGMAGGGKRKNTAGSSYVCIYKGMHFDPSLTSPHPFPVAGVGNDLLEKAIVVIQNLVHTLNQNPRVAMTCSDEMEEVEELLWSLRSQIWGKRKIFVNPQNYNIDFGSLQDLLRSVTDKLSHGKAGKDAEELSKINSVVYALLSGIIIYRNLQALKNPIDSMPEQFRDIVKRGLDNKVEFIDIAGDIIDSLLTRAIPYEDIVKKLCGGKKRQSCSFCRVQIEVTEYSSVVYNVVVKNCSSVLFNVLSIKKFTCDSQDCHRKAVTSIEDLYKLGLAVGTAFDKRRGTFCDFCFQRCPPGDEHRCRNCLTVTYCSKDCYLEDREEHSTKYCTENDRKTKGDSSMRRQMGEICREKLAGLVTGTSMENREDLLNEALEAFQFEDKTKKRAGDNPDTECEHDISIPAAATVPTAEDDRRKSGTEPANTENASEDGATAHRIQLDQVFNKMPPKKVCIVGSGNWGSAISRLVGHNAANNPDKFVKQVPMWVFEEEVDGSKLSTIINTKHENVKYLPGRLLPHNIVAEPDLVTAAKDADLLIFVLPHQFIPGVCQKLRENIKAGARAISLIKGFHIIPESGIKLVSSLISESLKIPVAALIGANIANEVADEKFCETTIGAADEDVGAEFAMLFQTDYFRVSVVRDFASVEICGALKNIVACAAGFCDGLQLGDNTKATVIRLGLKEMISFVVKFWSGGDVNTFLESCGVADLVTTCYGGRNRRVAAAFVNADKTISQLEAELLNGQKLQGPETAHAVNQMLKDKGAEEEFPIFTQVHRICCKEAEPMSIVEAMRNHPARL